MHLTADNGLADTTAFATPILIIAILTTCSLVITGVLARQALAQGATAQTMAAYRVAGLTIVLLAAIASLGYLGVTAQRML